MDVMECPRLPGEGYEKCDSICGITAHAEINAIKMAKSFGMDLKEATLYLTGHEKPCYDCKCACDAEGMHIIVLEEK